MRLLLDVHISSRKIGSALKSDGHDVVAADSDEILKRLSDDHLLEFAYNQRRIVITRDVKDFPRLTYDRLKQGKETAGCIVVVRIPQRDIGTLLRGVRALLKEHPKHSQWRDRVVYLSREK